MEQNPFAAPTQSAAITTLEVMIYPDAGNGLRFLNYLLDLFCFYIYSGVVIIIISLLIILFGGTDADLAIFEGPLGTPISFGLYASYYILLEGIFGLTIGKLITGTRVVRVSDNQKAGFGTIIGRSLCRLIPFEVFSFFRSAPGGWHDSLSNTRTIDKHKEPLTEEEYQMMLHFTF